MLISYYNSMEKQSLSITELFDCIKNDPSFLPLGRQIQLPCIKIDNPISKECYDSQNTKKKISLRFNCDNDEHTTRLIQLIKKVDEIMKQFEKNDTKIVFPEKYRRNNRGMEMKFVQKSKIIKMFEKIHNFTNKNPIKLNEKVLENPENMVTFGRGHFLLEIKGYYNLDTKKYYDYNHYDFNACIQQKIPIKVVFERIPLW